ncbi:putative ribonuclease H-like domain-containing protein [Tanacetum coccineum]
MAFVSTPSSTNKVNIAYGVSTANTQVSTTSAQVSIANLSDATVYAFLANQLNGSQLVHEDLEHIHEDDLEEMDLKWQLVLLSMRTRSLDKLIGSHILDKSRKGLGFVSYNAVPPPPTGLFVPPNLDLSNYGLEEFQQPEFEGYGPKTSKNVNEDTYNKVRESHDASLVEELVSDDKLEKKTIFPAIAMIEFVRAKQQEKPVRKPVKYAEMYRERVESRNNYTRVNYNYSTKKAHPSAHRNMAPIAVLMKTGLRSLNIARPVNTAHPKTTVYSARPMLHFSKSAQSTVKRPYKIKTALTNRNFSQKVNTAKGSFYTARPKAVNTVRPNSAVVNAVRTNQVNVVKALACWVRRPAKLNSASITLKRHNYVDARGRSKSMMAWAHDKEHVLSLRLQGICWKDYTFGGGANSVLFTDTGCFVLSPDFKLADESQVLLKVPRKNNMYSVDIKNIIPKESLTCLVVKATLDELMLWHRRLGHIRVLVVKSHNKTPYELFRGKFDGKSDDGFFVGYSLNSKAFRVYNIRTRKVEENLHIRFLEDKPIIACDEPKWLFDIDVLIKLMNYVTIVAGTNSNDSIVGSLFFFGSSSKNARNDKPQPSSDAGKKDDEGVSQEIGIDDQERPENSTQDVNTAGPITTAPLEAIHVDFFGDETELDMSNITTKYLVPSTPNTRIHKDHSLDHVIGDIQSGVLIRRMTKTSNKQGFISADYEGKTHEDLHTYLFACFLSQVEPKKVIQALTIEAMQDELLRFKLQKVWTLVDLPFSKRAIGTKWVYMNKKDKRDFVVYQMDVKSAFLYGKIEDEVYVCQPSGFEDPEFPDRVYKVEKALYGLHQALRAWYETLSTYLLDNRFQRGQIDKTLFNKRIKSDILLVQVYVDDIIFGSTKKELCTEFDKLMHKKFQMSSMGELTFFLGLQVSQKVMGLSSVITPMETSNPLLKDLEAEDVDVHLYRSMIRSLMYLTASRPDIMKSTTEGCQFLRSMLIAWQCKKQTIVANSTTKAEYVATANCCGQTQKPRKAKRITKISQSSGPIALVANETIIKEWEDRMERAATAASNLEAKQDSGNINRTQSMATLNKSFPQGTGSGSGLRVNTRRSREDNMKVKELMDLCTKLPEKTNVADEAASTGVDVRHGGAATTVTSLDAGQGSDRVVALETDLQQTKKVYGTAFIKLIKKVKKLEKTVKTRQARRKAIIIVSEVQGRHEHDMEPDFEFTTAEEVYTAEKGVSTAEPVSTTGVSVSTAGCSQAKTRAEIDEEERQRIARVQEEANSFNIEEWDDIRARLINEKKRYFAAQRAKERRNKPLTQAQQRTYMSQYIKNMGSHILKQLKSYSFEEIKNLFETTMRRVHTFVPMESESERVIPELAAGSSKRDAEKLLIQTSSKRLKDLRKLVRAEEPKDKEEEELSQERIQQMMIIVPEQGINVEALQTKYPIIDWEIYTEGARKYWKIIRVGNHTESERRENGVELKRLFEPDTDDELWKLQKHIHDNLTWKLYDSCGVHHVST